jgi:TIR- and PNP-associating SLOG family
VSAPRGMVGRRLHVAGSASPVESDPALLRWTHDLLRRVVLAHIESGGTVLTQIGADPHHERADGLRTLFDWTVMEACREALADGRAPLRPDGAPLVRAVCISSGRRAVSEENEATLSALRDAGALDITQLPDRYLFGVMIRQAQAEHGDVLLTIGGGLGVEQLAQLYADRRNPVVPLDIDIGSYRDDSPEGGAWLAKQARVHPDRYFEVTGPTTATAHLDGLRTGERLPPLDVMCSRIDGLLRALRPRQAFFIRLLDRTAKAFDDVEWFFRTVVDPVVAERGLQRMEVGTDPQLHGFMNTQIFTELHFAAVVVADMTDQRPNCAIELGYALARGHTVILCAREGERPAFDIDKLPFLFWARDRGASESRAALNAYWDIQANRPPVVSRPL